MSMVQVHNISDRPNTDARSQAVRVGRINLRPGKSTTVDRGALNETFKSMHGSRIWIGKLPPKYAKTSKAALKARALKELALSAAPGSSALTLKEAREYLDKLKLSELMDLPATMVPPVTFKSEAPSKPSLIMRLSRAAFQPTRQLDPEVWFWLGRWTRSRSGDYALKE